jgi:hypothetical protein
MDYELVRIWTFVYGLMLLGLEATTWIMGWNMTHLHMIIIAAGYTIALAVFVFVVGVVVLGVAFLVWDLFFTRLVKHL